MALGEYIIEPQDTLVPNRINVKFFALVDLDNVVLASYAVTNENCLDDEGVHSEEIGASFVKRLFNVPDDIRIIETWHYRQNRNHYAYPGATYDPSKDMFFGIPLCPSFVLNDDNQWIPPIPEPDDGLRHQFNCDTNTWSVDDGIRYVMGENGVVLDDDGNPLEI